MKSRKCDLAIVGGGLAGGMIALALNRLQPDLDLLIINTSPLLGGNRIWSFFVSDIEPADRWLVAPLVSQGWRGHDVRFAGHSRSVDTIFYSVESERLDQLLRERLPRKAILCGRRALAASAHAVVLDDGTRIEAGGVIDTRGLGTAAAEGGTALAALGGGWQQAMGQTLVLEEPHRLTQPVTMDATVDQAQGLRFMRCLPLSPVEIFVEEVTYGAQPQLDPPAIAARIAAYAAAQGWLVSSIARETGGALPVIGSGEFNRFWQGTGDRTGKAGLRAGLFHPFTGFALPDAVRLAINLAGLGDLSGEGLVKETARYAAAHWQGARFYRLLAALHFEATKPEARALLLERFYQLDRPLIERFYEGRSTLGDKLRILRALPPLAPGAAFNAIRHSLFPAQAVQGNRQHKPAVA